VNARGQGLQQRNLRVVKPPPADASLPHDELRELALLGAILVDNRVLDLVKDLVEPQDFYAEQRGKIFDSMRQIRDAGEIISRVSLVSWLTDRGILQEVGGPMAIATLDNLTPVLGQAIEHANKIAIKSRMRSVILHCQRVAAEGFGDVGDEREWIDRSTKEIRRHADKLQTSNAISLRNSLDTFFARLEKIMAGRGGLSGYSTGLKELDRATAGWKGGEITLIGGETGLGKSAFAGCQALAVASKPQIELVEYGGVKHEVTVPIGVAIFSLEMRHDEFTQRLCCGIARVNWKMLEIGEGTQYDVDMLIGASHVLSGLPIFIDDEVDLTMSRFEARVARIESYFAAIGVRLGLVIMDYFQLMDVRQEGDRDAKREQQLASAGRRLKNFSSRFVARPRALVNINGQIVDAGFLDSSRVAFGVVTQLNNDGDVSESKALLKHSHNFWVLESTDEVPEGPGKTTRASIRIKKQRGGERNVKATCWRHAAYTLYSDEER
jgi:replicative DNA helicase